MNPVKSIGIPCKTHRCYGVVWPDDHSPYCCECRDRVSPEPLAPKTGIPWDRMTHLAAKCLKNELARYGDLPSKKKL